MSCAKIDPTLHQAQKPSWIKVRLPSNPVFFSTKALISDLRLHTVCESAQCPNRWECWSQGTATFMIAGDRCTRACGFCAVMTAKPFALEEDEPQRVAEAVCRMKLKHVVITAVARDDLKDGGAGHFAQTIAAIREMDPSVIIEVLVPDFHAQDWCIQIVLDASPDIYNHNMETVERLTPQVRSRAKYRTSLQVLHRAKELSSAVVTKSGVMLGLGEEETELFRPWTICARSGAKSLPWVSTYGPLRSICRSLNTSRRINSAITVTLRGRKGFSMSPLVRWFAALITRPTFIRYADDEGDASRYAWACNRCYSERSEARPRMDWLGKPRHRREDRRLNEREVSESNLWN